MNTQEMTSIERMAAFVKGEPVDRIPTLVSLGESAVSLHGYSVKEYSFDSDVMADVEAKTYEMFKPDGVGISLTLRGIAEAMGSVLEYRDGSIPLVSKPIVQKPEGLLKLSPTNPIKDGRLPIILEGLVKLKYRVGHEVGVSGAIAGPVSVAVGICGAENFLKWTRKFPDEIKTMLEIVVESNKRYIDELVNRDITSVSISDPVTSTDLLGRRQFLEFSLPYFTNKVHHIIKVTGKKPSTHICGRSAGIWKDIVETGISSFSIDNVEDLQEAKEVMGNDVIIVGNVPPVDVMKLGDRQTIRDAVKSCILKGHNSPKGYIISTGCQVPIGTPREHIEYYFEACREFGAYPLNMAKISS